ncbi:hypothetical protein CP557_10550 [Natrinema ejinorense]|uniref:Uncharacterized protein n=1 Tax=Natrinema ejinorense TaxID=373386 RepID=A0A2A5QVP5_9EURY|nr:hypothetical protein CP557_10550 [Natrinema ejinorense]
MISTETSVVLSWQHGIATPSPTDSLTPDGRRFASSEPSLASLATTSRGFEPRLTVVHRATARATAYRLTIRLE